MSLIVFDSLGFFISNVFCYTFYFKENQLNIKLPSKTFVEMDPVCLTRRNMAKNDIEGYDKIQFQSPKVLLGKSNNTVLKC